MKHFLPVIALFLFWSSAFGYCNCYDYDLKETDKQEINISNHYYNFGMDRSLTGDIKAYLCSQTETIEIELYDIKEVNIYIVNSTNEIFDCITVDSSIIQSATMDAPTEKGIYYLIVDSPILYGEGCFQIR